MVESGKLLFVDSPMPNNYKERRNGSWWKRRNQLEKTLLLLSLLFLVITLGLIAWICWFYFKPLRISSNEAESKVCLTPGCIKAANMLLQNMDGTKNPCTEFYDFACGGFVASSKIPERNNMLTQFGLVAEHSLFQLKDALEEPVSENDTKYEVIVKDFYASCVDLDKTAEIGLQPVADLIHLIGGWPVLMGDSWNDTNLSWEELTYTIDRANLSSDYFLILEIIPDIKEGSGLTFVVTEPKFGTNKNNFKKGKNNEKVQNHLKFLIESAVFWGADRKIAEKEMEEVLDFELEFVKYLSSPDDGDNNLTQIYTKMNISQLYELNPEVDWIEYIEELYPYEINESESIIVKNLNYVKDFTKLLNKASIRTLANYVVGRIIRELTSEIDEKFRELRFNIFKNQTGIQQRSPRWMTCIDYIRKYFHQAIGSIFVKNYFKPEAKLMVTEIVKLIQEKMKDIINNVTWADSKTIQRAVEKLDAVTYDVAHPDDLLNSTGESGFYELVTIDRNNFFENMRNVKTIFLLVKKAMMMDSEDEEFNRVQLDKITVTNAYYNRIDNSMKITAGILQGVFFAYDRPQYMNFAAIGSIIGHEFTHGFDHSGKQFDKKGNIKNWWEPVAEKGYETRAQCMVEQYSNCSAPENGLNLNGKLNLNENIADNGGLKAAFYAYNTWVERHGPEKPLPGLNYTINQLFWMSFANVWCTKMTPQALKTTIETDVHSIPRFRVNIPLANMRKASEDFQCPVGSALNPTVRCNVW